MGWRVSVHSETQSNGVELKNISQNKHTMDVQLAHARNKFFKRLKNYTAVVRANASSSVDDF